MPHIVKRRGRTEPFDSRKVYASVYSACRNAHLSEVQSEKIAEAMSARLDQWMTDKQQVSSQEIFAKTFEVLQELHQDAAFLYKTHRDIS